MHKNHLRRHGVQLDLFRPASPRPTWQMLPPAVRQRVQQLLARLLKEHRDGSPTSREGRKVSDE